MNIDVNYKEVVELMLQTRSIIFNETALAAVSEKGLDDFVTQVDVGVQEFIEAELTKRYPEIQFLGEEKKAKIDFSRPCWILDPIDGTTNLIHHFQHSAVSLALYADGGIVFGAVYNPFTGELFHAVKGEGAYLGEKRIQVTKAKTLYESLIGVGTTPYRKDLIDANFATFKNFLLKCQDIRRCGSAELDLCYVAVGRQDGYFERTLSPWDFAAGSLIVEEAGGKVTDIEGNPLDFDGPSAVVASNGLIHEEMLGEITTGK
ncbi:MAG: inositol monophosphatase [Lachnospiraceae bacterium]|nr:inositol monophosphatase [Lachnospiraceae bacterium]